MDRYAAAAAPPVGPEVLLLAGHLILALVAAALLSVPVSWLLLRLYRRALLHGMRLVRAGPVAGSPRLAEPASTAPASAAPPAAPLVVESVDLHGLFGDARPRTALDAMAGSLRDLRRTGLIHFLGGCAYAVVETVCFVTAVSGRFDAPGVFAIFWTFAWPGVLALNLTGTIRRREHWFAVGAYAVVEALLVLAAAVSSGGSLAIDVVVLWLIMNLTPTLLFGAVLARWVRAVGPLVLTFLFLALAGADLLGYALTASDPVLRTMLAPFLALGMPSTWAFLALLATGLVPFAAIGAGVLLWIGRRYEAKRTSDQTLTVDALVLLFASLQALFLMTQGLAWIADGVAAFAAFKVATVVELRRSAVRRAPARQLLLLRVFALGARGQRMFDVLTRLWLRAGPIALIAGPDLASSTVEPHEFLGFVGRRMARRFVRDDADLRARLASMDLRPDPDGRYRVNELFCHQDTWRDAVTALVAESDAVLMDLRGFSVQSQGCVWELGLLLDVAPLDRCVLLVDATTDEAFLRRTLQNEWQNLPADSPNRYRVAPAVRLARAGAVLSQDVQGVIRSLTAA
jgi:hypothetical protein